MFLPLRDDAPQLRYPAVTYTLLAINLAVFFFQWTLDPAERLVFVRAAGAIPWEIAHLRDLVGDGQPRDVLPPPLTIYTALFIHGDLPHLGGNLWFLWLFGQKLEGLLGSLRFASFFLATGTLAAVLQVGVAPDTLLPMVGASGAIAGVLGAYAVAFRNGRVRCLVFLLFMVTEVRLSAHVLLGLWFLAQVTASASHRAGVAWVAHVGGFLVGAGLAHVALSPRRLRLRRPRAWRESSPLLRPRVS